MIVRLKNGEVINAEAASYSVISLVTSDSEYIPHLYSIGINGGFVDAEAELGDETIVYDKYSRFIGLSVALNSDNSLYCVISFARRSEAEILAEEVTRLTKENERLSEYAEAGKIMFGEEEES